MNEETGNTAAPPRAFSLPLYLLIVFGVSWPFQVVSVIWGRSLPVVFLLNAASMCMVTVGTFLAGRYVFRDGFAGAGWSWGRLLHYLAVIGLAAVLWILPAYADIGLGLTQVTQPLRNRQIALLVVFPFIIFVPGFGEEFGWRGYMLPRMAATRSPRKAVLLHAVIWWAWHLPILAGTGVAAGLALGKEIGSPGVAVAIVSTAVVLLSAVPAILHGVVFAYIWLRSRSLAVATVYHAVFDGFRDGLGATVGVGPIAGAWANVVIIVLGVVLLASGKWDDLRPPPDA
ncbi:MAG: CPBP family intramembrane metalloprotease [Phycisphaerae bacterium]|nr:CPBP family intramembrane metalloprotease [Phycisphaerae bacterium]